jgi:hypothetical protein
VPDWQERQVLTVVEPMTVEYVPAMQAAQETDEITPKPLEYVPERQDKQVLEAVEAKTVEYVPEMQFMHRLDMVTPVAMLYLPVWQDSQFTPDQFAGGWICVFTGKSCHVLLQPPTP